MNKKTIYIIVAVLVIVIVVAGAGILLMNNGGNGGETTPIPTVVGATTLQFSVNDTVTATKDVVAYQFACKNFNTSTEVMRVDLSVSGANYSYVLDAGQQKSWASMDNGATWTAGTFGGTTGDWANYGSLFNTYVDKLAAQSGTADLSYTTDTSSVIIFGIAVNPTIADSVFATS